jgi:colicin import membrane protein
MSKGVATIAQLRERDFRLMVALSAGLHVGLSLLAVVALPSLGDHELPAGPMITMITPAELAARTGEVVRPPAPKPKAPEPKPLAEPTPPPPPPPDQIVIPEDTHRKPVKPKPAPVRDVETRRSEPAREEQVDLEDLLIEERILSGQMPGAATVDAKPKVLPGAGGTGAPVSAEVAAWQQKVRAYAVRNWGLTPGLRNKGLKTLVNVELTASGVILDSDIERSSGNPWFDDSVERFLEKAGSLPAPPDSGEWQIEFNGDF